MLRGYWWPGNVRELQHAIERAVLLCSEPLIGVDDLPEALRPVPAPVAGSATELVTLEEAERLAVIRAMEHCRATSRAAAGALGIHRPTLYSKLRKYGRGSTPAARRPTPPTRARCWRPSGHWLAGRARPACTW